MSAAGPTATELHERALGIRHVGKTRAELEHELIWLHKLTAEQARGWLELAQTMADAEPALTLAQAVEKMHAARATA